jgi:hypothetical protein
VIVVQTALNYATASLEREAGGLAYIIVSLLIEAGLKVANRCRTIRGFFIYTSLPIVVIEIAFGMHNFPSFDLAYFKS